MDEHPGDTLGKRFLTFWGGLAAIGAVALLLGLYRWAAIPSDSAINDGGAGARRLEILSSVRAAQNAELNAVQEVEAGKIVRIPPAKAIDYAATALAALKAAPGPVKTPAALAAEAEKKASSGAHDPNLSKFEGK